VPGATGFDAVDATVEDLAHDERLARALLEPAQVNDPVDDHLATVDRRYAGHRNEDPAASDHLDNESDHARRLRVGTQQRDHITHPAHLLGIGVEDLSPGKARHEDSRRGGHVAQGYSPRDGG